MRAFRAIRTVSVLALGVVVLAVGPSSALGGVSGPSTPAGTPPVVTSRLTLATDTGVLVGETNYRLSLWRGGRSTQLADLGGSATAINASGWFTGTRPVSTAGGEPEYRATTWSPGGVATDVAPAGSTDSTGLAIADDGTVLLRYTRAGVERLALRRGGELVPLSLEPDARIGGMNDRGQVVASAYRDGVEVAVRCTPAGRCATLPQLPRTLRSLAYDINDSGVVVGLAEVRTSRSTIDEVAVVWRGSTVTALPGLSAPAGQSRSGATHVNETGLVGGYSGSRGSTAAVVWRDGAVVELAPGTPRDTYRLTIAGMNDAGEVVGGLQDDRNTFDQKRRGFLWRAGSLTTLDPSFPHAVAVVSGITASGLIYGSSVSASSIPLVLSSSQATTWKVSR